VDARGMHVYTGASSTPAMEVDADGMSVSGANGTMYFNVNNTYEVPRITCAAGVQMMNGFYQQMETFYPIAGFLVDPSGYDGATISISGKEVPLYYLDSSNHLKTVNMPAFSEGLDIVGDRVIISFESACNKYFFGKFFFATDVASYPVSG
jgi:hypothetical protein